MCFEKGDKIRVFRDGSYQHGTILKVDNNDKTALVHIEYPMLPLWYDYGDLKHE